jgi:hypothetical protein
MNIREPQLDRNGRTTLAYFDDTGVFELDASLLPEDFRADVKRCIAAQKQIAAPAHAAFKPNPDALAQVSEAALAQLLERGTDVHGISRQRHISDVIVFSADNIAGAVQSDAVEALRVKVDAQACRLMRAVFPGVPRLVVGSSGHFWYPQGSYMGWHTNSGAPGWRIYINYAEEEGKSFFRYRDTATGQIVTLMDKEWNIRIFEITGKNPLWHAVYSDTNRFSLGYIVYREPSLTDRVKQKMKQLLRAN